MTEHSTSMKVYLIEVVLALGKYSASPLYMFAF